MMRTLGTVFGVFCVTLVLSEAMGAGFLWSQGLLTAQRVREIRDLFGPQEKEAVAGDAEAQRTLPSAQDVLRERSLRVLALSTLETEVGLLKTMLETERNGLIARQSELQKQKKDFEGQLKQLTNENTVAAREQARAILAALSPTEAVARLMELTPDENVLLLREMPEAKIAELLEQLASVPEPGEGPLNDPKQTQDRQKRAKDLFERLSKGEPRETIIRAAAERLGQADAGRPTAAVVK